MHIYFSGIGGSGLSSLANLALDFGFRVSGSDLQINENTQILESRNVLINYYQNYQEISNFYHQNPFDWVVYSSAIKSSHPELEFASQQGLKISKRDELLNYILDLSGQQLIAFTGTHGKTTSTAMFIWLCKNLNLPLSHLVGTNLDWAKSGVFSSKANYFVLEADEYDRNFLNYQPYLSTLTSIDYDHPDIFETQEDYYQAFRDFFANSKYLVAFNEDLNKINYDYWQVEDRPETHFLLKKIFQNRLVNYPELKLVGLHNRQNAALVRKTFEEINNLAKIKLDLQESKIINEILNNYPGSQRRLEKLRNGVYSDYAHHPTEIQATLQSLKEITESIVVVYQPHQNVRQVKILEDYQEVFKLADKIYWLPTFLTREDPELKILDPEDFLKIVENPEKFETAKMNNQLKDSLIQHFNNNQTILFMGAGDIDDWARKIF